MPGSVRRFIQRHTELAEILSDILKAHDEKLNLEEAREGGPADRLDLLLGDDVEDYTVG